MTQPRAVPLERIFFCVQSIGTDIHQGRIRPKKYYTSFSALELLNGITNRVSLSISRPYVNGFLHSCLAECEKRISINALRVSHLERGRNTDAGDDSQPTPTQEKRTNSVQPREFFSQL